MATPLAITAIDTSAPWFLKPWIWKTPLRALDPEKEYLAVHTWGRVPYLQMSAFTGMSGAIWAGMDNIPAGGLIGYSGSFSPGFSVIAETVSVWASPEAMGVFYTGEHHRKAAASWKPRVWVTKVWIKGSELEDSTEIYARIKRGDFREATEVTRVALRKAEAGSNM